MKHLITRRVFAKLSTVAAGAAAAQAFTAGDMVVGAVTRSGSAAVTRNLQSPAPESDTLQSEFLMTLVINTLPANNVGSVGVNRVVVPVSDGTFDGPQLKGTVVGPSGDWIVARPDGSSLLDVRLVLQTDDAQKIYMMWRGISYTPPGGPQYARILPMFETGAAKYGWLNHIVSVGVHRPTPGKVVYRIYRIL